MTRAVTDQPLLFRVLAAVRPLKLEPSDRLVLLYLAYRQGRHETAWPGLRRIASDTGLSKACVEDSIKRLCRAGLIEKPPSSRGRLNSYTVRLPNCPLPQDTSQHESVRFRRTPVSASAGHKCPLPQDKILKDNPSLKDKGPSALFPKALGEPDRKARHKRKRKADSTGKSARRIAFVPPTVEEVRDYADSRGNPIFDGQRFVDYYEERHWIKANGQPVLDWKGTVRAWIDRDNERRRERGEPPLDGFSQYGTHPATEDDIRELVKAGIYPPEVLNNDRDADAAT
jgi:hypothetical protein